MTAETATRLEGVKWQAHATVEKWDGDQVAYVTRKTGVVAPSGDLLAAHLDPYETVESPGNLLTTAGLTRLTALLTATGSTQALTNTATRIGVGDTNTAATISDTDLAAASGSTHRFFMPMDATYPSASAGVVTAKATFGASDANFTGGWQEWCLDIGAPTVSSGTTVAACMANRKVASLGTKVSPAVWSFTITITIS